MCEYAKENCIHEDYDVWTRNNWPPQACRIYSTYASIHRDVMKAPKEGKKKMSKGDQLYFITLTAHPDDPSPREDLERAYDAIIASKSYETLGSYGCLETTQQGVPHLHFIWRLSESSNYPDKHKLRKYNKHGPDRTERGVDSKRITKTPDSIDRVLKYVEKPDTVYTVKPMYGLKESLGLAQ